MKKSRKSRVSWPSDANLCQVKVFLVDECPSKVYSQPQSHKNKRKPLTMKPSNIVHSPDLPPGFEGNCHASMPKQHVIPRIKWKCPPKFIFSRSWLVGAGEESTERQTENLREAKVLEAIYPHRSAIPSRPSVSPVIEAEHYDDSKTPVVRLTPVEEEEEIACSSSNIAPQTNVPTKPQTQAIPDGRSLSETPVNDKTVPGIESGIKSDVSLAASAVLTALVKSKEQGSMIDTDLLVKILSDPKMVENLMKDDKPKPPKKEILQVETKGAPVCLSQAPPVTTTSSPLPCPNPTSTIPTPMAMDKNSYPLPNEVPFKPSISTTQLHSLPVIDSKRVEPTAPTSSLEPMKLSSSSFGHGNVHMSSTQVQTSLSAVPPQVKHIQMAQPAFSGLPMNVNPVPVSAGSKPVEKLQPSFSALPLNANPLHIPSGPRTVQKPRPAISTLPMTGNPVQVSAGPKPGQMPKPSHNSVPPQDVNPLQVSSGPRTSHPVKDLDYFKNLIRKHGTVRPEESHENHTFPSQTGNYLAKNINVAHNLKPVEELKAKIQKPCMFYQTSRGCKLGANCMYLHNPSSQWRTGSASEAPSAKRIKFGGEVWGR